MGKVLRKYVLRTLAQWNLNLHFRPQLPSRTPVLHPPSPSRSVGPLAIRGKIRTTACVPSSSPVGEFASNNSPPMAPPGHQTVAFSAPGKVLLAGGYLVLDRQHTGLVFGLSARIHAIVTAIHTGPGVQLTEIVVESPQFVDAQWRYGYHLAPDGGGIAVTQLQT